MRGYEAYMEWVKDATHFNGFIDNTCHWGAVIHFDDPDRGIEEWMLNEDRDGWDAIYYRCRVNRIAPDFDTYNEVMNGVKKPDLSNIVNDQRKANGAALKQRFSEKARAYLSCREFPIYADDPSANDNIHYKIGPDLYRCATFDEIEAELEGNFDANYSDSWFFDIK